MWSSVWIPWGFIPGEVLEGLVFVSSATTPIHKAFSSLTPHTCLLAVALGLHIGYLVRIRWIDSL